VRIVREGCAAVVCRSTSPENGGWRRAGRLRCSRNAFDRGRARLTVALDEPVRRYLEHALAAGAAPGAGSRLTMSGRIKVGAWLPFTAVEQLDGRSFTWRARVGRGRFAPLTVVDRFAGGVGSTEGSLFGRIRVFGAAGPDTARSAAGRAALEAIWTPAALLPERGVRWLAVNDEEIVATFDVPPERPDVHLRIDRHGAVRSASALRWGDAGQDAFGYIPCGCLAHAERRFGDVVVPGEVTVGWWFGTPRWAPFFKASIRSLESLASEGGSHPTRARS